MLFRAYISAFITKKNHCPGYIVYALHEYFNSLYKKPWSYTTKKYISHKRMMPKNSKYNELFIHRNWDYSTNCVQLHVTNVTAQLKYSMAAWIINEVAYDATFWNNMLNIYIMAQFFFYPGYLLLLIVHFVKEFRLEVGCIGPWNHP